MNQWTVYDVEDAFGNPDLPYECERVAEARLADGRIVRIVDEAWVDEPRTAPDGVTYWSTWCRVVEEVRTADGDEITTEYGDAEPCGWRRHESLDAARAECEEYLRAGHPVEYAHVAPEMAAATLVG